MTTVALAIGVQKDAGLPPDVGGIPHMDGVEACIERARKVLDACRTANVAIVFCQEVHRADKVDFGRELDGAEGEHCLDGELGTERVDGFSPAGPREYLIVQRRYCAFFGTDLEILLRGLGATRLILFGNLTDVNLHYTFLGAHMRDFHLKVLSDAGIGSSEARHGAAFEAMAYLQRDAVCTSAEIIESLSR
jgi:nicotinamidase-related amidase